MVLKKLNGLVSNVTITAINDDLRCVLWNSSVMEFNSADGLADAEGENAYRNAGNEGFYAFASCQIFGQGMYDVVCKEWF